MSRTNAHRRVRAAGSALAALFLVSAALLLLGSTARAAPDPTPNGVCGALNMVQDPSMLTTPMTHDASQGNAGMSTAVDASGCS